MSECKKFPKTNVKTCARTNVSKKKHEKMPSHDVRRNVTVHVRICAVICVFCKITCQARCQSICREKCQNMCQHKCRNMCLNSYQNKCQGVLLRIIMFTHWKTSSRPYRHVFFHTPDYQTKKSLLHQELGSMSFHQNCLRAKGSQFPTLYF